MENHCVKRQNPWGERLPCVHGHLSVASAARIWTVTFAGPAPTFLPAQVFAALFVLVH